MNVVNYNMLQDTTMF